MSIWANPNLSISTRRNTLCNCLEVTVTTNQKVIPFTGGSGVEPVNGVSIITQASTGYTGLVSMTTILSGTFAGGDAAGYFAVVSTSTFDALGGYSWSLGAVGTALNNGASTPSQYKNLWGLALFVSIKNSSNVYVLDESRADISNPGNLPDMVYDIVLPGTDSVWYIPIPNGSSYKIDVFAIPTNTITIEINGAAFGTIGFTYNANNLFYNDFKFYKKGTPDTLLSVADYATFLANYTLAYPADPNDADCYLLTDTGVMSCYDYTLYDKVDRFVLSAQCCAQEKAAELITLKKQGDQQYMYKLHELMALNSMIEALRDHDDCMTDAEINSIIRNIEKICCSCC